MFGMLHSASCHMNVSERRQWQGYVCGVCLALRDQYGQPARLVTNSDAALLALLHDSLARSSPQLVDHRCLLRRPYTAAVPDPRSPGLHFAALIALLAAASKVLDRLQDGEIQTVRARLAALEREDYLGRLSEGEGGARGGLTAMHCRYVFAER